MNPEVPFSDEVFLRELEKGWKWERFVAGYFASRGIRVEGLKHKARSRYELGFDFRGSVDMYLGGLPVEVKSRNVEFRCPDDLPWEELFVMTEHDYDEKDPKPAVVVCVSQVTKAMVWIGCDDRSEWKLKDGFDRIRQIEERWWCAPRRLWRPIQELVHILLLHSRGANQLPERTPW